MNQGLVAASRSSAGSFHPLPRPDVKVFIYLGPKMS
jgi:hypothetical protein